jgi:hypothetical protein
MARNVECGEHGRQGIAFVCTHIAHATDSGAKVGFFMSEAEEMARPDAWCSECRNANVGGMPRDEWMELVDFKIFCALCWDFAKEVQLGKPDT